MPKVFCNPNFQSCPREVKSEKEGRPRNPKTGESKASAPNNLNQKTGGEKGTRPQEKNSEQSLGSQLQNLLKELLKEPDPNGSPRPFKLLGLFK